MLLQADAAQLEIVCKAHCTNDPTFIKDILEGIDFHVLRASLASSSPSVLGRHVDYEEFIHKVRVEEDPLFIKIRKAAKAFSFAKEYGAGPAKLAEETGLPVPVIKAMMQAEDARYPLNKHYYENVEVLARRNMLRNTHTVEFMVNRDKKVPYRDTKGDPIQKPAGHGIYRTPFGAILSFPEFQKFDTLELSMSPTMIKNYPIQHFAAMVIYSAGVQLFNGLRENNFFDGRCLPINTVHDSFIFDVKREVLPEVADFVKKKLESAVEYMYNIFCIKFNLPLRFDLESGPNWKHMTKVKV